MTSSDLLHNTAELLATLLSSKQTEANSAQCDNSEGQFSQSRISMNETLLARDNDRIEFCSPSLSLVHDDHLELGNQKEAEMSALQMLSRPMGFEITEKLDTTVDKLSEVGNLLLANTSESFAVLVDSRLRAHAKFLSQHGLSKCEEKAGGAQLLESKLETLLEIGNRVSIEEMESKIELVEAEPRGDEELEGSQLSICHQTTLKLRLESPDGSLQAHSLVRFEVSGYIVAEALTTDSNPSCLMGLVLDSKSLLSQMKSQASGVVAQVVDLTNSFFVIPEPKMYHRGDSYIVMPPPATPIRSSDKRALIDFQQENKDVSSMKNFSLLDCDTVSRILLPEEQSQDPLNLSPDQCANILDDVFGSLDVSLFSSYAENRENEARPVKRAKVSE